MLTSESHGGHRSTTSQIFKSSLIKNFYELATQRHPSRFLRVFSVQFLLSFISNFFLSKGSRKILLRGFSAKGRVKKGKFIMAFAMEGGGGLLRAINVFVINIFFFGKIISAKGGFGPKTPIF